MGSNGKPSRAAQRGTGDVLLRVSGLRVVGESFGITTQIVKGIDLTLRRGEVLGLIGESGAGKSTIGLAAMGYAKPGCRIVAGSVLFDGQDLVAASGRQKRRLWGSRIAYVPQSAAASFNPAHRLADQCTETAAQHRLMRPRAAADRILSLFRQLCLPDPEAITKRYPHQVSGGQLQRAATAMALSCRPDVVVFDEPTTALDVTTQIEVLAAIRQAVRENGTAAIYISHDLAVVAQMADRVMVLRHGQLVEEASTADMLAHPKEPYTRSLWAVRSLDKEQESITVPILEVRGIDAGYRGHRVLHEVSLSVPKGQTVAVVGESGSGKSTLARTVTGLLTPTRGEILFDGRKLPDSLARRSRDLRRRIQMVHQMPDTALNPRRRVRDILDRSLRGQAGFDRAGRHARIHELLDMVELSRSLSTRFPDELSGGQKQRLSIARALAVNPSLIICDEVTSALDQIVAEGVLRLLLRLQRELHVSYLYITHDLATVRAIADWVVVMHQGEVVQQGPKNEVLLPPHHPYTELLLSSVPRMEVGWLDAILAERAGAAA